MAWILFLLFSLDLSAVYCRSHTLHFHITLASAPIPGLSQYSIIMYMDGVQYARYNSDIRRAQFYSASLNPLSEHLDMQTKYAQAFEVWQRHRLNFLMGVFNTTNGEGHIHVYQRKSACELHDDGTIGGYQDIAFDGKEFLVFDKETAVYIPSTQEAVMVSHLWNKHYDSTDSKMFIEIDCIKHMKLYLLYISNDLEKKVPPNVKISSSESESGTKLHCLVYGFYPRDVKVKWIKNETDEIYSEESAEIRPNPDGTYQIRVSVEVTPEEGATYSCHVDHRSLENILVVPFVPVESNKKNILYIIIPVGSALLVLLIVLGVFIYRKVPSGHQSVSTEDGD
ncbi:major histocompatibility complex nonclassical class Ib L homeolog precursor [Xenopus laevis]|uniref:Major histocompatibility complex nonclassical class Ib L homeolog precursor n=1 Tax=Xenopus laevis TaxID=8355 RepID=A9UM13_XENLA|nr:major histocompatibility complex, class 1, UB alpha chain, subfamily 1, member 1 L homeolog precursor [Xenopus laevis]AAI57483.1 Unknown (protein for MGC:180047) [Xenopus laevis]